MKINSNTISLEKEDHAKLEEIVTKIASDNSIENIEAVNITLTQENGLVSFKKAEFDPEHPWAGIDPRNLERDPEFQRDLKKQEEEELQLLKTLKSMPTKYKILLLQGLGYNESEVKEYLARSMGVTSEDVGEKEVFSQTTNSTFFKEAGKGCGYVSEKDEDKKKVTPKGEEKGKGKKMTPGDLKTMGMAK